MKVAIDTVLMDAERRNNSGAIRPAVIIVVARVTGGASPSLVELDGVTLDFSPIK